MISLNILINFEIQFKFVNIESIIIEIYIIFFMIYYVAVNYFIEFLILRQILVAMRYDRYFYVTKPLAYFQLLLSISN